MHTLWGSMLGVARDLSLWLGGCRHRNSKRDVQQETSVVYSSFVWTRTSLATSLPCLSNSATVCTTPRRAQACPLPFTNPHTAGWRRQSSLLFWRKTPVWFHCSKFAHNNESGILNSFSAYLFSSCLTQCGKFFRSSVPKITQPLA